LFASLSRRVPRSSTFRRDDRFVKIVRLANYVAPASGGLRTALAELGAGYLSAGHEPVLVVPGVRPDRRQSRQGLVITVPGVPVPGSGGYRAITARRSLRRLLEDLQPDRLEVSDRTTLRWTGAWARRCGIRSMMVSHDSLAALAQMFRPPGLSVRQLVDRLNRNTAASFDVVVCTTAWAAAEFRRLAVPNVVQVPLGVDLAGFHPSRFDESLRSQFAAGDQRLLVHCSRLSPEKRPERAIGAVAELRRRGARAVLVVAGDGPLRRPLQASAARLPVRFLGHVASRESLARLLATADVVIAPGPAETFGLSALEALASGTPVVVSSRSALPEVVGQAGLAADDNDVACADAVQRLLRRDPAERRRLARQQAQQFGWPAAVNGFLGAHGLTPLPRGGEGAPVVRAGT
jgi:alpha-1,6-mannosyltransferase